MTLETFIGLTTGKILLFEQRRLSQLILYDNANEEDCKDRCITNFNYIQCLQYEKLVGENYQNLVSKPDLNTSWEKAICFTRVRFYLPLF